MRLTPPSKSFSLSGTGHMLIVPYFNTQVGNATLFNITNTDTDQRQGRQGPLPRRLQLRRHVRLPAVPVAWRRLDGQHLQGSPTALSRLTTTDKSCTLPAGVGNGSAATSDFVTARLPGTLTGDALATQTREGYVEILNMADITPTTATGSLSKAITHVNGVPPARRCRPQ